MLRIKELYIYLFLLCLLAFSSVSLAQYSSEEELKKAANTFFNEENFIEALPLFSQLLSTYPKDVNYNYKYGACYLFATRDKEKSINYLSFAVSKATVEPLAYYYMAKAYHHNYDFASAIVYYNKYKTKSTAKEHQKYQIDRQVEMCENGQKLLKKINNIGVLDKKEIRESEFFRSYDLRGIDGKVIVKPDDFQSKADKKNNDKSILFSDPNQNTIVYSSYGDKGTNKDIYKIEKIGVGNFSEPINLGSTINTDYDEDYAFLHPDGKTLYFSSKGHNSMGGYDIFKSIYNNASGTWSKPINLDFPINTPDDDVLYISDIDNQLAYFASSRASKQGEMTVYRVKVEPEPIQNPMIKGVFLAEQNPNMKDATISIMDANTNTKLGVYQTDSKSGEYLLTFPKAETKYKLIVETTSDAPIHSAIIEIPAQTDFALLKQQLLLVGEGDNEKLVVKNMFDEVDEFDITNPIIVQNLLKQRAKLDVNITEEEALSSLKTNLVSDVVSDENASNSDFQNYSDDKLVTVVNEKISTLLMKTKESEEQTNFYYNLANEKTAASKKAYASNEKNKMDVANDVNQGVVALNLARVVESESTERNLEKQKLQAYKSKIAELVTNGKRAEAEEILSEINKIEKAGYFANSAVEDERRIKSEKLKETQLAANEQRDVVIEITNRKLELEKSISELENKLAATKKAKEKEETQAQIDVYKIDLEDIVFQENKAKQKELELKNVYLEAKNEMQLFEQVLAAKENSSSQKNALDANQKLAIERNITYFKEEGIVGYYPTQEELAENNSQETATSENLVAIKDAFEIIDDNGNLIDYNTSFSTKLAKAENETNTLKKAENIAQINEEWIKAIDEDIQIKNYQIEKENDLNAKVQFKLVIDKLNELKIQKQTERDEQLAVVSSQSVENNSQDSFNSTTKNANTNTEANNNLQNESIKNTNSTENLSTNSQSILDDEGNVIDYNSVFLDELEALPTDEQTSKLFAQKSMIYAKWADATAQEILFRKNEIAKADEIEKDRINALISELETDLQDKEEFAALFLSQAKSLASTDEELAYIYNLESNSQLADNSSESPNSTSANNNEQETNNNEQETNNNEQITNNNEQETNNNEQITNNKEQIANNNEQIANNKEQIANNKEQETNDNEQIANNNEQETNDNEQIANNKEQETTNKEQIANNEQIETYKEQVVATPEVNRLKNDIIELRNQSEELLTEASQETSSEEKNRKIEDSEAAIKKAEEKELQLAAIYEKVNANEFNSNKNTLGQLIIAYGSNSSDNNFIMAEMLNEEALDLFSKAASSRQNARTSTNTNTRNKLNEDAFELELKAIQKQQNAILLIDKNNLVATNQLANNKSLPIAIGTNNNEQIASNKEQIASNNEQETNNKSLPIANGTNNKEQVVDKQQVYEPKTISIAIGIASNEIIANADKLMKEAEVLNAEAKMLEDSSLTLKKKKEKEAVVVQVEAKKEEANRKIYEADVLYAEANELKIEEQETISALSDVRSDVILENITIQDELIFNELSPESIATIKGNDDYKAYVELKQENRRLIKDAQVEYIEADKAQQESVDQVGLEKALKAMEMATDSEAGKQKLQSQLVKLEQMIADNELKAARLRDAAIEKEKKALENQSKASDLLSNNDAATSSKFVAIEKAEYFNPNLVAQKIDGVSLVENNLQSSENNSQITNNNEQIANNNEQRTNNNEQIANNNEQIANNNEQITNNNEQITNNNEQITNNKEVASNNQQQETNNNKQITNNKEVASNNQQQETNNNKQIANDKSQITNEEIPEKLTNSIFSLTSANQSAYSNSKPIPKNPKMPEGLVFKVQIGAFRNPIPQDLFKGFTPVMAEDAGNGITRYTAGLFTSFNVANEAKNSIREIGYPDAFVVAFFNGKRININEARAMLNEPNNNLQTSDNNAQVVDNKSLPIAIGTNNNSQTSRTNETETLSTTEEVKDGISKDVRNIDGIFYTVQVGVYSKEITAGQLNNLSPINSERTANGLIRYTSGIYKNLDEANAAKDRIRNIGISDAFVIAYHNGKKITVTQASDLLKKGVETSSYQQPTNTNEQITNNKEQKTNNNDNAQITNDNEQITNNNEQIVNNNEQITNNNEQTTVNNVSRKISDEELQQKAAALNIVFKVKIGAYEEDVPTEDAAIFLKLSDKGVENFEKNNITIYTVGSFLDYKSALNYQIEITEMGIKNPSVIAFENDEIIPIETAIEKIKNN